MSDLMLVTFHWKGDSDDLQRRYDDVLNHVVDVSPARPLVHLAAPVDDGFRVWDLWTDEGIARKMVNNPSFRQKLEEYGLDHATIVFVSVHRQGWPVSQSPMYR